MKVDITVVKEANKLLTKQMKALDAVFELHKKKLEPELSPFKDSCKECRKPYPCRTLQVIEKVLND